MNGFARMLRWVVPLLVMGASGSAAAAAQAEDPAPDLVAAREDMERGNYDKAAQGLRELLEEHPDLVEARVLLLAVLMADGEVDQADALAAELAAGSDSHPVLVARADHAFWRGQVAESERLARLACEHDARDLHARYQVARALRERGERKAARDWVAEAAKIHVPRTLDADGLLHLARLYAVEGLPDSLELAAQCCVHAERKRKEAGRPTTDVLVLLGDLELQAKSLRGDTPRAFATYLDALEQNGSLVAARVGRAWTHLYVFNSFEAEKEVDAALDANAHSVEALTLKAWLRVMDGRHHEALELITRALEVNPSAKKARAVRAAALHLLNDREAYDAEVQRVLELDPSYGELFWTVGDGLSHLLRFADAVPFHQRALEVDPELQLARISLGRDLSYVGREAEAREALEGSKEAHPFPHPWRHNMLLLFGKFDREFLREQAEGFVFRMHVDENPILGPRLADAFKTDLAYLSAKYQWRPAAEVLVEMFPAHADFSVRSVGMPGLGAVGACFGELVTLVSPRSELRHNFSWRRTALHELAHVITLGRSKGRVPRWLTEGLSVYEERCGSPTWARDQELELLNAYYNDELVPLESFNAVFRGPRIGFAYYQGGLMCQFFADTYGFDTILAMLDAFADDLETPAVIERVYGCTAAEMDVRFRAWVHEHWVGAMKVQPQWSGAKRRDLRTHVRTHEDDVAALADLAVAYYQAGKEVDADAYLVQAMRIDPDHPVARRLAAQRAMNRRRPDLAKEHLEVAFAKGGAEYYSALLLAQLRKADGDLEGAKAALELARTCYATDPGPGNPDLALKDILEGEGDVDGAMEALRVYVERAENDVRGRLELASFRLKQERAADAYRLACEVEQIDPFLRDVYVLQGKALRAQGEPGKAVAALRWALLVDPRTEPGYSPPPDDEAREDQLADDRTERADILVDIAEIELDVGDHEAAERDAHEALNLVSDHARALELVKRLDS